MLEKTRSRSRIKKPKKVLQRKAKFHDQSNIFKRYHAKRTSEETSIYAQQRARERLANPTPAETAFKEILYSLGLREGRDFEREKIIFYANGGKFIIADFFLTERDIIVEIDGSSHELSKRHDEGRDKYFRATGRATIRFSNRECLKNPQAVAEAVRKALGINGPSK